MTAALKLSDEQAEALEQMRGLSLPISYMARQLGISRKVLAPRLRGYVGNPNPRSLARRIARVERIKAHIAAMPGIPMTIASEAIE